MWFRTELLLLLCALLPLQAATHQCGNLSSQTSPRKPSGDLVVAGGGFASVRCVPPRGALDMSGARALTLRCSGDGRSGYKLTLKTDANMDGVSYQQNFTPASSRDGTPQPVRLPLSGFRASFRGMPVPNAPPLRGEDIVQIGIMLSRYDEGRVDNSVAAGQFRLRVASLEAER